jgi:hypothetical protein
MRSSSLNNLTQPEPIVPHLSSARVQKIAYLATLRALHFIFSSRFNGNVFDCTSLVNMVNGARETVGTFSSCIGVTFVYCTVEKLWLRGTQLYFLMVVGKQAQVQS